MPNQAITSKSPFRKNKWKKGIDIIIKFLTENINDEPKTIFGKSVFFFVSGEKKNSKQPNIVGDVM